MIGHMSENSGAVEVELDDDAWAVLEHGLAVWDGPVRLTATIAVAIGYASLYDMADELPRLLAAVRAREGLSPWDWRRVLFSAELAFGSDVVGAGTTWADATGLTDEASLAGLRTAQHALKKVYEEFAL